jgi:hypothetical protein
MEALLIMRRHPFQFGLGLLCLAVVVPGLCAEPPADKKAERDPYALAARLDRRIEKQWEANKVVPAPLASDTEFLRRVYLDLAGRIPRTAEVRDFLEDKDPAKRRRIVEALLGISDNLKDNKGLERLYVSNFTNMWRAVMLPPSNNQQVQALAPQMEAWLRRRIRENVPYDKMVRDLLTAEVGGQFGPRGTPANQIDPNAYAFYQANEMKPENLAAASSRLFLGIKLECAQCHNHPFAKWKREQFWEFASFFASVAPQQPRQPRGGPMQPANGKELRELKIPNTTPEKTVQARFLDGKEPEWKEDSVSRAVLADWMTSSKNPYFARAMANRLWAHFFGIGIIDPVDEFGEDNQPSHPELLDELGKAFADSGFDAKFLIRAIMATRAYQTTSEMTDKSQEDLRLFARVALKGLTPEQLFDSLALATGYKGDSAAVTTRRFQNGSARGEFLTKFANFSDRRTEYQTSILQALMLMNGKFVADADTVDLANENAFGTLTAIYDAPAPSLATTKGKLDALFLATLSRPMRAEEESRLVRYVDKGGPSGDSKKALADVFWTLLNSSEFILNH